MLQFDLPRLHAARKRLPLQRKILVVNGHPDPSPHRFCSALCDAYEAGAHRGGWEVKRLNSGAIDPELAQAGESVPDARALMEWSERLTVVFPLWLDKPPVRLCEIFRRAMAKNSQSPGATSLLLRPSRMVVTMDMPAFAHRALLRQDEAGELRQKFALPGINSEELVFMGSMGTAPYGLRETWLHAMRAFGEQGI